MRLPEQFHDAEDLTGELSRVEALIGVGAGALQAALNARDLSVGGSALSTDVSDRRVDEGYQRFSVGRAGGDRQGGLAALAAGGDGLRFRR